MKRTTEELAGLTERFAFAVRAAGVKLTPQRAAIYREVARTDNHPDIETVFKCVRRTMPSISLDTVYRAMALFAELGLVATVRPLGRHVRFDANISPHHHFICTRCGATVDFKHREFDTLRVPASAAAIGRVDSRHVELRGFCARCAGPAPASVPSRPPSPAGLTHRNSGTVRSRRTHKKQHRRD